MRIQLLQEDEMLLKKSIFSLFFLLGCSAFLPAQTPEAEFNYPAAARRVPGTALRVMSYNILADRFNRKMRPASERAPEVSEIIKTLSPDIAGLQEADEPWYPVLAERIAPYKFAVDPYDTTLCAVIYDSRRFRQTGGGNFAFVTEELRCLRYTVLEELKTKKRLIVTNTHWSLKPFTRLANAALMIRYIKELQLDYPGVPVICTGDFNCTVESAELMYFLKESGFSDAVETAEHVFNKDFFSWFSPDWKKVRGGRHIDHIIFSPGIKALNAGMIAGEKIYRASDHTPVIADLEMPQ